MPSFKNMIYFWENYVGRLWEGS